MLKQPWEMTLDEWFTARNKLRPDFVQSRHTKASASSAVADIKQLEFLLYSVGDADRALLKKVQEGEVKLSPEDSEALVERLAEPVTHRRVVEKALAEGKKVPVNVLGAYPDLFFKEENKNVA